MQRSIDLSISTLASLAAVGLSWPYWRSHGYFAESTAAWATYFALGFVLSIFVFYVFLRALRTLFTHDIPGVPGHAHGHPADVQAHHHAEHAHHHAQPAHHHAEHAHPHDGHGHDLGGGH